MCTSSAETVVFVVVRNSVLQGRDRLRLTYALGVLRSGRVLAEDRYKITVTFSSHETSQVAAYLYHHNPYVFSLSKQLYTFISVLSNFILMMTL
jgi:hypothetical protein